MKPDQHALQSQKWPLIGKSQWCCSAMLPSTARATKQLDAWQQLANTPPLQSTTSGLHPISIQQVAPPDYSLLLTYWPWKDERLSWPSWLTYSRWLTHTGGHPSAAGRAQDRESSLAKDRHCTAVPSNQCHSHNQHHSLHTSDKWPTVRLEAGIAQLIWFQSVIRMFNHSL